MGVEDTRPMQDDTKRTGIGRFTEALDSTGQSRRSITASDVAIRAGVSQSAVSRCFTPGTSVSERMRDRVMQAAQALGYRPNLIARSLITRRSGMIGVAVGSVAQHLYPGTLQALATRLQAEGYRILLFTAPPDGQADPALEQIMAYQGDAVILAAATVSSQLATQCRAAGIPVVLYNRTVRGQAASSVTCTNRIAGTEIAALFAAGGHRRPAFIAFDPSASTSRDRERGFREGCRTYGLPDPVVEVGASTDAGARQAMTALLRRRDPPDATAGHMHVKTRLAGAALHIQHGSVAKYQIHRIALVGTKIFGGLSAWPACRQVPGKAQSAWLRWRTMGGSVSIAALQTAVRPKRRCSGDGSGSCPVKLRKASSAGTRWPTLRISSIQTLDRSES